MHVCSENRIIHIWGIVLEHHFFLFKTESNASIKTIIETNVTLSHWQTIWQWIMVTFIVILYQSRHSSVIKVFLEIKLIWRKHYSSPFVIMHFLHIHVYLLYMKPYTCMNNKIENIFIVFRKENAMSTQFCI